MHFEMYTLSFEMTSGNSEKIWNNVSMLDGAILMERNLIKF